MGIVIKIFLRVILIQIDQLLYFYALTFMSYI